MDLRSYLRLNHIPVAKLAKDLDVSRQHIYDIIKGRRSCTERLACMIDYYTKGQVSNAEMLMGYKQYFCPCCGKRIQKQHENIFREKMKKGLAENRDLERN